MKKMYFIILVLLTSVNCFAQFGEDNIWLFRLDSNSKGVKLNFYNGNPQIDTFPININMYAANASISDANGNLLFYSNGYSIMDASNNEMQGSAGFNPDACNILGFGASTIAQAVIAIPYPMHVNHYLIFHEDCQFQPYGPLNLYCTEVNMNGNGGLGSVEVLNNLLINDHLAEGIAACKHANGRDWWLVLRKLYEPVFIKFLLTPYEMKGPFFQNIGLINDTIQPDWGQWAFSPDGSKLASTMFADHISLYDFDRCNGELSNYLHLLNPDKGVFPEFVTGGVSFSPSSRFVYNTSTYHIFQYDLKAANIDSSRKTVATIDSIPSPSNIPYFYHSLTASDKKIYIKSFSAVNILHVINSPDSAGIGCNVVQRAIHLPDLVWSSMPNYPNYRLGALAGSACDSLSPKPPTDSGYILHVIPNPTTDEILIRNFLIDASNCEVSIYNSIGQRVYNKTFLENKINVNHLADGLYVLNIYSNGKSFTGKFVKE